MKRYSFILLALFTGCIESTRTETTSQTTTGADTTKQQAPATPEELCFVHYDGSKNQDTTTLMLKLTGSQASGKFTWRPYEKDARSGGIKGVREGDKIRAMWTYMQEGMVDSLEVEFRLDGDKLYRTASGFDEKTGREKLNASGGKEVVFMRIDCSAARP